MGNAADLARKACAFLAVIGFAWPLVAGPAESAGDCPDPGSWHRDSLALAFERERLLDGFPTPLRSTGRALIDGDTVWWRTETPIASTLRIDAAGVWQSLGDGEPTLLARSAGGDAAIADLMTMMLSGDLAAAAVDFVIEQDRDPASGDWLVTLTPRTARLAAFLERIRFGGCENLRSVTIEQPGGDVDRIVFSELD